MRKLLPLILVILFGSCSSARKSQSGSSSSITSTVTTVSSTASATTESSSAKDGSNFEKAIVIKAKNEMEGVSAEYQWLKENYPGYRSLGQSLQSQGKKHYDVIKIKTKEGEEKLIYFDITNFFGKF